METVSFCQWSPSIAPTLGKTIHYKGFAARLDFTDEDTQKKMEETLQYFEAERPDTLVWDGDDYEQDSFTAIIPDIYERIQPLKLVMFLPDCESHKERVRKNWSPPEGPGLPIVCYLLSAELSTDYEKHGKEVLKATQSEEVVCFGGGKTLAKEYQNCEQKARFVSVGVRRPSTILGAPPELSHLEAARREEQNGSTTGQERRASLVDLNDIAARR